VPQCLLKNIEHQSTCSVPVALAVDTALATLERSVVRQTPGASYVSLDTIICDSVCGAARDGVVRYQDSNHLSARYAASLAAPLGESLGEALGTWPGLAAAPHRPPR